MKKLKKLLNIILLKEELYQRLRIKKKHLIIFIVFVGLIDVFFILFTKGSWEFFVDKQKNELYINIAILVAAIPISGIFDLAMVTFPLGDVIRNIKMKNNEIALKGRITELNFSAVYVFSHIPIIPFQILFSLILLNSNSLFLSILSTFVNLLLLLWVAGVLARGAQIIYDIKNVKGSIIFSIIYAWLIITSFVMNILISGIIFRFLI